VKKIIFNNVILIAIVIATINSAFSADITVNDIINKMQQNLTGMNDIKSGAVATTYMGTQLNTMTQKMNYYFKKPDKIKIEILTPVKQTMVIIGENMTIKTVDGKISTMNLKQMMGGMGMNQQYFGADMTSMLKNYNITLDETLSDKINNIYTMTLVPKEVSQSSSTMGAFIPLKIEIFVDYNKGIIIKQKIYSKGNTPMAITEVKDTRQIEGIWFPIITQSTTFLPNNQQMQSEMRFENVQVNTGIGDGEFETK